MAELRLGDLKEKKVVTTSLLILFTPRSGKMSMTLAIKRCAGWKRGKPSSK
jgi:hypothetical protein